MKKIHLTITIILLVGGMAQSQPLDELLQKAVDNNPQLKALQLRYEAALQKGGQVKQLPDPKLGLGLPVLRPETRLGAQVVMVSASQMFPWFGTLKAKEGVAIAMAKTQYEWIAATRLDLFFTIKQAYYQLYLIQEKQGIISRHLRIFEGLENVALTKVESGRTSAADVLRVKLKLQELRKQAEILEQEKTPYFAQINEATNQAFTTKITIEENFAAIAELNYDLAAYQEKMAAHHPLLIQLDAQLAASKKEQELNDILGKPSFGVGLDYSYVAPRKDARPEHNGRDILIPKMSVAIPIFKAKYQAKNQEEALKQTAITYQKEALVNKMLAQLQSYQADYESALISIELAELQQKTAAATYDILLGVYSSKGSRFDELLLLLNDQINYDLAVIVAKVKTHLTKAKVARLTDF